MTENPYIDHDDYSKTLAQASIAHDSRFMVHTCLLNVNRKKRISTSAIDISALLAVAHKLKVPFDTLKKNKEECPTWGSNPQPYD